MAYTITKTDGTSLGTITDGTINTSFTSLTLIGRNYSNYGQFIANDLVHIIENFAYSSSPSNPLAGQLWWDTGTGRLKVYTGSAFKVISSATVASSAPSGSISGDLWFDSANAQLYIYDGATWILVGPQRNGSGAIWEQITDTGLVVHDVLSVKLNNARTEIISLDTEFTPNVAITGFSTIKTGINANTSVGSATFWGLANNSSYLGGQLAASYLRSDANDTATGAVTLANLTIGLDSNLTIATDSTGNATVRNTKSNGDMNFYLNVGGVDTNTLHLDANAGIARMVSVATTGALTVGTTASVGGALTVAGTGAFTGNLTAPTQSAGTADTTVATTAFVVNGSAGLFPYKVYNGTTHVWTDTTSVNVVVSGTTVATASSSGFNLTNGATAITQTDAYNGTGNARVATTQFVKTASTWWGNSAHRSAKWVSTAAPDAGVNDVGSNDGDIWFQREA
jgi:hypothetical protein